MKITAPRLLLLGVTLACGGGLADGAAAEDLEAARRCAAIDCDAARLACYDGAFKVMTAVAPQRTFGDTGRLPAQMQAEATARDAAPKTLDARASAVSALRQGLYRLTLDNGQVWTTLDSDWSLEFHADDRVTITRMPLGGYQLSLTGRVKSVSAKRIQ